MHITLELSYYPMTDEYAKPVNEFIDYLKGIDAELTVGTMSTLIIGEYSEIMKVLTMAIEKLMTKFPSVFTFKISNACQL